MHRRPNRRVRLALRRPSAWRHWRRHAEARIMESLSTPEMLEVMETVWVDLMTYGTAKLDLRRTVNEMVKVTTTPMRKWFRLTREVG